MVRQGENRVFDGGVAQHLRHHPGGHHAVLNRVGREVVDSGLRTQSMRVADRRNAEFPGHRDADSLRRINDCGAE